MGYGQHLILLDQTGVIWQGHTEGPITGSKKKLPKFQILKSKTNLNVTHRLKLVDDMYKMDWKYVEDTELTQYF